MISLNDLPAEYNFYFQGLVDNLLQRSSNYKKLQLANIQARQDNNQVKKGLSTQYKDPLAATFLQRDQIQKKRKREVDLACFLG